MDMLSISIFYCEDYHFLGTVYHSLFGLVTRVTSMDEQVENEESFERQTIS